MNEKLTKEDYIEIAVQRIDHEINYTLTEYLPHLTDDEAETHHLQGIVIGLLQDRLNYYKQTLPTVSWFKIK